MIQGGWRSRIPDIQSSIRLPRHTLVGLQVRLLNQCGLYAELHVALERLGYGASVLGSLRRRFEGSLIYARHISSHGEGAGSDLGAPTAHLKCHRRAHLQLGGRCARPGQPSGQRHAVAGGVSGGDQLLGACLAARPPQPWTPTSPAGL